ncbi:MAG: SpoVR family protein [Pseudobdellovibrionaceae bacterium]|nr:SpoVR family protein [Bdellovibrionales bacterium]USN46650.1 MAG: SpoVR family protein [Pseudobdellovibrionaceae bacterium]
MANITPDLEKARQRICKIAEDVGLDFFETIFELVKYNELNAIAARGGFPVRYPHWRWGMDYEQLSKGYEYGLSKIYELVINTNPCYAYLMEGNEFVDQKLVMAHVYGHCDFFKNNQWFSQTDRKMIDTMANHATRIRRYIDSYGIDVVEDFIDKCLSIDNLIDIHGTYRKKNPNLEEHREVPQSDEESQKNLYVTRDYMEAYLNPEAPKREMNPNMEGLRRVPEQPVRDVMSFLIHHAPLPEWQQDIMSIIRDEALYFAPQGMTKIMNEGWASYWHSRLMTEKIANDGEIIDFADRHSGTMAMSPGGFNPYKVGIELFRDIERRWNMGQFGKEWNECTDLKERKNWDRELGQGREKIFQVRRDYNDVTFIDEFLTEEFCVKNRMFVYRFNKRTGQFEVDTRDFPLIKKKFLFQLTNFGQPIINVIDANFRNRSELLLGHIFEGIELQPNFLEATLKNVQAIWKRPVNLATVMDEEARIFTFDGREFITTPFSELPVGEGQKDKPSEKDKKDLAKKP